MRSVHIAEGILLFQQLDMSRIRSAAQGAVDEAHRFGPCHRLVGAEGPVLIARSEEHTSELQSQR